MFFILLLCNIAKLKLIEPTKIDLSHKRKLNLCFIFPKTVMNGSLTIPKMAENLLTRKNILCILRKH